MQNMIKTAFSSIEIIIKSLFRYLDNNKNHKMAGAELLELLNHVVFSIIGVA